MSNDEIRYRLVSDYLDELRKIQDIPQATEEEKKQLFSEYKQNAQWIDIYDTQNRETIIGFLLIGVYPNCHPDADYYIEEAYVKPKYRRSKHMTKAVIDFVKQHPGVYCMFILNNNYGAYGFWNTVFKSLGYERSYLRDVGAGDPYCTQYGFKPR